MINTIIGLFRNLACKHKAIKAFYYNRNYELGSGNESHPLLWIEDPISGRNQSNTFLNTVNFSILFVPENESDIIDLQNLAFSTGLNIIERIKNDERAPVSVQPSWTFITLRNYYDNNACGCRFTIDLVQRNIQNLCLIDEQFDEGKKLTSIDPLNGFDIKTDGSCETYVNKLPEFDLKTSKI